MNFSSSAFCQFLVVQFLAIAVVLATCGPTSAAIPQIAQDAKKVLEQHCYKCHGENGVATAGLHVLKWEQLTGPGGPVVGRNPNQSDLYEYMADGIMPPEDDKRVKVRPTDAEIAVIRKWILGGAPSFEEEIRREFISPEMMIGFIQSDLRDKVRERDRRHMRYFTLTHLYNAGIRNDEIDTYRLGLSKLINSLSWKLEITVPKPIDPQKTIYRIDLRDFDWDVREYKTSTAVWDAIIAQNPYNIEYATEAAGYCSEQTRHKIPYVRGDWFVAAASRPPLYHHILEIPQTDKELEKRLGVNVAANIAREKVVRAGFTRSGVSDNNRLIERHQSRYGAYWKSYDFGGNKGRQLLTRHPLGPGANEAFFKQDGGEIIFNLPNGLQAYMLIKADGQRIDEGPINIVRDKDDIARNGGLVVNGLSCMHCHNQGMIRKGDEIRPFVLANSIIFRNQRGLAELIKELYPKTDVMDGWFVRDADRHIRAARETGSPVTEDEKTGQLRLADGQPVVRLSTQFHNELDLNLAAVEAGVRPEEFKQALRKSISLAEQLGLLLIPGKTVKRDTYVAAFPTLIRELRLGRHVPPSVPGIRSPSQLITNSIGMQLKRIPAGEFLMGSGKSAAEIARLFDSKAEHYEDEHPQHRVKITKPFYLQTTEVTQGQWSAVMGTTPWKGEDYVKEGADYAATYVSWDDAVAYCRKLSAKDGRKYRLPTEAEWEYACRAGTKTMYGFGDSAARLSDHAWYDKNAWDIDEKYAHRVGQKKPNAFGLYDMHGNVYEWCQDRYGEDYYKTSPQADPRGPTSGSSRVLRGGSWRDFAQGARSARRVRFTADGRNYGSGFRVVCELE